MDYVSFALSTLSRARLNNIITIIIIIVVVNQTFEINRLQLLPSNEKFQAVPPVSCAHGVCKSVHGEEERRMSNTTLGDGHKAKTYDAKKKSKSKSSSNKKD